MDSVQIAQVDVLIVGAGFSSFTLLRRLLKLGLGVRIYEKGGATGGVWYWNCYPGARVDTDAPIYQLFDKDLWNDFTFSERYPSWQELRRYFDHVEKKWKTKDYTTFNKEVVGAIFNESRRQWLVECADGTQIYASWFLPCIGFASKHYTPLFPGLDTFQGQIHYAARWPQQGVDLKGKRIAVIGTGASGTQIIQEIGDNSRELTIFLRTPNLCLPMRQKSLNLEEERQKKLNGWYEKQMQITRTTAGGFIYDAIDRNTFDDSEEDRQRFFHHQFNCEGGFAFWLANYKDVFTNLKANQEVYNFWRNQVLARIKDPRKQELLAPATPPHPWGTKRPSLEQRFYEVVDQPHINIVDVNTSPITEVTSTGIKTKNKDIIEVDVIILATGFHAVTGSLAQLNIRGTDGRTIAEYWKVKTKTALGIAISGFPNMFFLYGPQAPTAFASGPTCTQFQAEWIEEVFKRIQISGITRLEATRDTEDDWSRRLNEVWNASLFPMAKSWYQGANIPGGNIEPLCWAGGLVEYMRTLNDSIESDWQCWRYDKS